MLFHGGFVQLRSDWQIDDRIAITFVDDSLPYPALAVSVLIRPSVPPETVLLAFFGIIEIASIGRHCLNGAAIAFAATLCPFLDIAAVCAQLALFTDPLVRALSPGSNDSRQLAYMQGADARWQLDDVLRTIGKRRLYASQAR